MNKSLLHHIDIWANADITKDQTTFYLRLIAKLMQELNWAENIIKEKDGVIKNLYERCLGTVQQV